MSLYTDEENKTVTLAAANVESEFYCKLTRVEEIAEFAKKMNYKKLGIATCVGLIKEAGIVEICAQQGQMVRKGQPIAYLEREKE